jgi:hypothetical protein
MAKKDDPAVKGVDAREQAKSDSVADYYARQEGLQPTPTQRENDLAKVGALDIDDKEDDGSEWEDEAQARVMAARLPANNPYDTRELSAAPERPARGKRKASE